MIEPHDRVVYRPDRGRHGYRRTAQHDDRDTERTGGGDLAVARRAAAVLGDNDIDGMIEEQRAVIPFAERAAPPHIGRVRQQQGRIDRIDAADQIIVLRRRYEWRKPVAPKRDKDAARPFSQYADRLAGIGRLVPAVATNGEPWRPAQRDEGNAGCAGGGGGVYRYDPRIRMRCVDHRIDPLFDEIMRKPGGAAETAAADRHWQQHRRSGPAGERQYDLKIGALGQALGQAARFGGAAEDKDA